MMSNSLSMTSEILPRVLSLLECLNLGKTSRFSEFSAMLLPSIFSFSSKAFSGELHSILIITSCPVQNAIWIFSSPRNR